MAGEGMARAPWVRGRGSFHCPSDGPLLFRVPTEHSQPMDGDVCTLGQGMFTLAQGMFTHGQGMFTLGQAVSRCTKMGFLFSTFLIGQYFVK